MAGLSLFVLVVGGLVAWGLLDRQPYVAQPSRHQAPRAQPAGAADALHRLEQAVDRGDTAAARALAPEGDPGAARLLGAVVTNARRLHVEDFTLRYVDEEGGVSTGGTWSASVAATWRFAGFDRTAAHAETTVRFAPHGPAVGISGVGGGDHRTPLWLSGPLQVRRTASTLVLVAGPAAEADAYARRAGTALTVVRRVLPRWRSGLVVEVPASAQALDRTLHADPGQYANIAAVTATVDGSTRSGAPVHVFVNPAVFGDLQPRGAQVVMSHEAVHVATGAATSAMPLWLVEGFADYVALRDVDLPLHTTAGGIIRQVRRHGTPHHLPGAAEFDTTTTHLGATYESAWLACRLVARTAGEDALVRLYDDVQDGEALERALHVDTGLGTADLTRRWRTLLSDLAS